MNHWNMADDDWDLYAVVRSCTNAAATSTASSSTITDATIAPVENSSNRDLGDSFLNSPSFQSGDHNSSDFPGFVNYIGDSFPGLEEFYKENSSLPQHNPTTSPSNSVLQPVQNPQYTGLITPQQQQYPQPQQVVQPQQYSNLGHGIFGSSLSFPSTSPQAVRPRRRWAFSKTQNLWCLWFSIIGFKLQLEQYSNRKVA